MKIFIICFLFANFFNWISADDTEEQINKTYPIANVTIRGMTEKQFVEESQRHYYTILFFNDSPIDYETSLQNLQIDQNLANKIFIAKLSDCNNLCQSIEDQKNDSTQGDYYDEIGLNTSSLYFIEKNIFHEFYEENDSDSTLTQFLQNCTKTEIHFIKNKYAIVDYSYKIEQTIHLMVFFGDNMDDQMDLYEKYVLERKYLDFPIMSSISFFYGFDEAVSKEWVLDMPYITVSINGIVIDALKVNLTDYNIIDEFLLKSSYPTIETLTEQNQVQIFEQMHQRAVHLLYDDKTFSEQNKQAFEGTANYTRENFTLSERIAFSYWNIDDYQDNRFKYMIDHVKDKLPLIIITEQSPNMFDDSHKIISKYISYDTEITQENILQFISDFYGQKIQDFLFSEDLNESYQAYFDQEVYNTFLYKRYFKQLLIFQNDLVRYGDDDTESRASITKLVAQNYEDNILDPKFNSLIIYYPIKSAHKNMKKLVQQIAENLHVIENLTSGDKVKLELFCIDTEKNEIDYPKLNKDLSIFFIMQNNEQLKFEEYQGETHPLSIVQWALSMVAEQMGQLIVEKAGSENIEQYDQISDSLSSKDDKKNDL